MQGNVDPLPIKKYAIKKELILFKIIAPNWEITPEYFTLLFKLSIFCGTFIFIKEHPNECLYLPWLPFMFCWHFS